MPRIALIGAGSVVFTRTLCNDILLTPALQESTIVLMDIDPVRLEQARALVQALIDRRGVKAQVIATTDRKRALTRADYVITTFQQGGLSAYALDIDIPARYGVGQCVGDTLGPGGVFRALRTIPVLLDICRELDDVSPNALLINYVNPMAANCWAIAKGSGRPHVGLCHSVQGTSAMLARWVGLPLSEITYLCAGINHQAWFLTFRAGSKDLYPQIRAAATRPEIFGSEPVRIELMNHFGYFVTESSGHASEYLPYFRKSEHAINTDLVPLFTSPDDHWFDFGRTGGYLRNCLRRLEQSPQEFKELIDGVRQMRTTRGEEYGAYIIEAIETNTPVRINGNIPNKHLITNLPEGCCVEVPCLVDGNGIQPTFIGDLPAQLAALNRTNINVQELIVQAALTGSIEAVHHAVMLDPLTASVCTLPQIRSMVTEMLATQSRWLPQFNQLRN